MDKIIKPARLFLMALLLILLIIIYVMTLYKLQIIDGEDYYKESLESNIDEVTVAGVRGNIMDRYGRVLVENRTCNNLVINETEMFPDSSSETMAKANASILAVCRMLESYGDSHTDTLPITKAPPYEYTDMDDTQRATLDAYLRDKDLPETTTAVELMAYMRGRYQIDDSYTAEEMRIIVGVRYEINSRWSENFATSEYIFAQDVSMDLIANIMENDIEGFEVEQSFVRDFNTQYLSHILGYIGPMNSAQLEKYTELGYPNDALVGRDGVEYTFEEYLHGVDGEARISSTSSGVVTSTVYTKEPEPGSHVYLTIDIGIQEAAENALTSFITAENARREAVRQEYELYGGDEDDLRELITGAGVAVIDINTGEPLALASWPGYDLSTIMQDYSMLLEADNDPLFNRALQGAYAPGSTFKPLVAMAGLIEGKIEATTTIDCVGVFDKYKDSDGGNSPTCWIFGQGLHGELNLSEALTHSCNIYFYTVGDWLQISVMAKYAKLFGLGESTGIELAEETGVMASDEWMQYRYGRDMYAGDTVRAAIGQSESLFTPLQLAEYCAAIANGGTRYSASILKSVRSYDFSETVYERETQVLSTVEAPEEYYRAVWEGMYGVANDVVSGSVFTVFSGADYTVAAKTGTSQVGEDKTNNGVFMCYAPYDNPRVAIAIVVEKGYSGASVAPIAREILDYYFAFMDSTVALESEGCLLQ